jgi:hypothetical protein
MAPYGESSAQDLVARFVESIGIRDEKGVVPFVRAWPTIAGRDLAAHSQILDVKNGALLVGLDHPAWLQRMQMEQRRIVKMVQLQFPSLEIRYLHLMVVDKLDPSVRADVSPDSSGEAAHQAESTDTPETTGTEGQPDQDDDSAAVPLTDEAVTAEEDPDFLAHLERLGEAIRRKNPE